MDEDFDDDVGEVTEDDVLQVIELNDNENPATAADDDSTVEMDAAVAEAQAQIQPQTESGEMDSGEMTAVVIQQQEPAVADRGNNALQILQAHSDAVYAVATNADGSMLVSGGGDDKAIIWRTDNWEQVHVVEGAHRDSVICVGFSADNQYVATGSLDGMIKIWLVSNFELVLELDCGDDLLWMQWHPLGRFLLAGSNAGAVMMWDVPAGNMSYFSGHIAPVMAGAWAPNGRFFVSTGEDCCLLIWSPKTQEVTTKVDAKSQYMFHKTPVAAVACHPDNVLVATGGGDCHVALINSKTGQVIVVFEGHTDNVEAVEFSYSSPTLLASASLDKTIRIYDVSKQLHVHTCSHDDAVIKIVWHPTLPIVYSASLDGTIRVWDARNGQELFQAVGHQNHVLDFVVVNNGNRIISCSEDSTIMVFDVDNLPSV